MRGDLRSTKQSIKLIRNGLPRPLRGLAMTPVYWLNANRVSYKKFIIACDNSSTKYL
ncbi:hypothetical protein [Candidatus Tisiphia endosymbiont of Hybos culiciformis]|uniref:hypothetical protein n=1 Tax=Candidatus Tisiphia endosymbiont of Hybos culiciformis TaxID=3139331 RepID=UPI003CCA7924